MKILVTGGTGVIGAGAIPKLLKAGHEVRLLSRGAERAAQDYPQNVTAVTGDVTDPLSLKGSATGCDVVVHIAGIVEEDPPQVTFEKVNVEGTRNLLSETRRAGAARFVYLSSLGVDTGKSEYHASKRRCEDLVRQHSGEWLILRPGNVYGPGDSVISTLLKMVRALPIVPLVGSGDQPFQPIWFEDLGEAISLAAGNASLRNEILELAGGDIVTTSQLLDLLCEITDRSPQRLSVPEWVAQAGTAVAETFAARTLKKSGLHLPINSSKLQMLLDENLIHPPATNALTELFGIEPTPLRDALVTLADELPELEMDEGVGKLERKRFWTDITGSKFSHAGLMRFFRDHVSEIMPIEFAAEPGVPTRATKGATLTGEIPGRGIFQVRVEEEGEDRITLATVQGHPLAGTVTFRSEPRPDGVRFTVEVHARASNLLDWIAVRLGGSPMQNHNWRQVVARVAELSGGKSSGVKNESETLEDAEAEKVQRWAEALIHHRKVQEQQAELSAAQ